MTSKIKQLVEHIKDTHVMGAAPLQEYHDAKAALASCYGGRDLVTRVTIVKAALKNYRVLVSPDEQNDAVRVYRADTNTAVRI